MLVSVQSANLISSNLLFAANVSMRDTGEADG